MSTPVDSRNQKQDLEGGSGENQQDNTLLNTYEDIGKESWKSIRWSLLLLLNLVAVSLDPLFFYIPVIDDPLKCLKSDTNLGITAISLRFYVDILQLILWLHCNEEQLLMKIASFFAKRGAQSNIGSSEPMTGNNEVDRTTASPDMTQRRKKIVRLYETVSVLPLPQVATIIIIAMEGNRKSPYAVTLLKFCVLSQFVLRAVRVYPSYKDATRKSPILLRGRVWFGAAFNLLLFVIVGHVVGAFWYLLSVGRNMDCWRGACKRQGSCDDTSLYCIHSSSGNKSYLNQSCPIETMDSPPFDFGIYLVALQSKIVNTEDFLLKLSYCFWWGLRNLSSLGQNLTTSAYKWEICFAITISIFGLVLFALLIGNMQTYLQCQTNKDINEMKERRDKVKEIRNKLIKWKPFRKLPDDLRMQTVWCEHPKWLNNRDFDLKSVLDNISPELSLQIKEQLCLPLLKKVPLFKELDSRPLKELCRRAIPEVYPEKHRILRDGKPIKEVILIVNGEMCAYRSADGRDGVSPQKLPVEYLVDEILSGDMTPKSSPSIKLTSEENIKTVTKVEAFTLKEEDWRDVCTKFKGHLYASEMRNWAYSVVQKWLKLRRQRTTEKLDQDSRNNSVTEQQGAAT